jgi:polyphosphate kinase
LEEHLREKLVQWLEVEERQVYDVEGMLDLGDLWEIYGVDGHSGLKDAAWSPVTLPAFAGEDGQKGDIFEAMRAGDLLVHQPYDSFATSVERLVEQAVQDPDVLALKLTVYRTSDDSTLIPSLIEAAERGKQAVCMVELKARFDERRNIGWARALEEAGAHVVHGLPGLKTHAKALIVIRREGDGVRHYAHIGTGNYNPKTARIYTDLGLFTADAEIGADIAEMFNSLTGYARPRRYRKVLVAPFNLQRGLLEEIERTIESHSDATPARIRMKMNSLLDAPMIRALYRASQAGVDVQLNVRGICALRPGVAGVSDNIEVVSIVGRFLEHSRVFSFERHGQVPNVYIGSADLMPRNLYTRVELDVPIADQKVRDELTDLLDRCLADNTHSWDLGSDGEWVRRQPDGNPRDAQRELIELHAERGASGAAVEAPTS